MTCIIQQKNPHALGMEPGDQFIFTRSWGNWHLMSRLFLVWNTRGPSLGGYDVDLWSIDNHNQLVDWLFHVGGKQMDHADYYEAMQTIFRTAGWDQSFSGKDLAIKYWNESVPHPKKPNS